MRQRWVFLLAGFAMCVLTAAVPSISTSMELMARQTPAEPPESRLVEDTIYVTEGIAVGRRLLPTAKGLAFRAKYLAVGVQVDQGGRLHGTPQRPGTYVVPVQLCAGRTCHEQEITLVVLRNVPWAARELTFLGRAGSPLDGEIGISGGPPGVVPTFTVTDHARLPAGVTIGPDGHVGGAPAAPGISEVPVRICVAGNCAGVVVRLIIV
ncbi:hypothetical protein ETD86_38565 [Nonomuraea turkmeniaca]|uniref:Uncharacterized protein n=1 Tax=Nonomuraea turkmeniaca TaxID=103838 RepID=A0A5S4F3H7_9ACTN|nr:hypothetical protein [Nonomuraea turkmeniaca]TMR10689.1 hypothetical protein ETD86_38565 [Nonomuraea turkmeniaca]